MKRLFAAALCVLLLAALFGCAQSASSAAPDAPAPSAAPAPPPLVLPAGKASVLTGREVPAEYGGGKRVAAVMVGNVTHARPQRGLSAAGILFESRVEGGITRFMALYEDYAAMPEVGPVRGFRESYLQLAMPFQPLLVTYGGGQVAQEYIKRFAQQERVVDFRQGSKAMVWDEARLAQGYPMENTLYTSGALLAGDVAARGVDDARQYASTFFHFVPYYESPRRLSGGEAEGISIAHSESYRTFFSYADGKYAMSQSNFSIGLEERQPTVDENNGQQVAFDNVLVLFTAMPPHPDFEPGTPLLDIQLSNGVGYYFNGGRCEAVRWMKQSPEHALLIVSPDGTEQPVVLNVGATYVALVDIEQAPNFSISPGGTANAYCPYFA